MIVSGYATRAERVPLFAADIDDHERARMETFNMERLASPISKAVTCIKHRVRFTVRALICSVPFPSQIPQR